MKMNKLLALVLAVVMALSVTVTALADWGPAEYAAAANVIGTDYTGKTIILHSNDVHGAIDGYAYMPTLKHMFEEKGATDVMLVDAGDFSQGTTYVSVSKGLTAIQMMNYAGYDLVTLGNHEFDFGYAQLVDNLSKAEFYTISCNVILDETGESILPGYVTYDFGNKETEDGRYLRIAFVGIETPETATKVNPGLIKEIHFTAFDDLYTTVQATVDAAKADEPDLVIALAHLGVDVESAGNGYRSIDLLKKVNGIDFVIDGHSHTVMTAGENGEAIQSTGTQFANVGVVVIDNATKTIEDRYLVPTQYLAKDADVLAVAKGIEAEVDAKYGAVFAKTEVLLEGEKPQVRSRETNLGDLICDAMVWSVLREGGIENAEPNQVVGITNGGGIRATVNVGAVTMNNIMSVLPFGNTVAVVYVTGAELLEALEASTFCTPDPVGGYPQTSGIKWTLDATKEFAQGELYIDLAGKETTYYAPAEIRRVSIEEINGEPFDVNATYAVVTNNFCAAGGDTYNVFGRAYVAGNTFDTSIPMDEAVVEYVQQILKGEITDEAYGLTRTNQTQILPEVEEAEEAPAA